MLKTYSLSILFLFGLVFSVQAQRCAVNIVKQKTEAGYALSFRYESSDSTSRIENIRWSTGSNDEKVRIIYNGKYCIRLQLTNGCVAEKCVEITDLKPDPAKCGIDFKKEVRNDRVFLCVFSTNPDDEIAELEWSNGLKDPCIPYGQFASSELCVRVKTKQGCELSKCLQVSGSDCKVQIERVSRDGAKVYLCASVPQTGVKGFQWSTGSTDRCIPIPLNLKEVCVKAIYDNGCIASACVAFPTDCTIDISRADNKQLCAKSGRDLAIKKYKWSTGDTSACITIPDDLREVCLQVVYADGCEAKKCISLVNTSCKIEIVRKKDDAGNTYLCAVSPSNVGPIQVKWSTGDTASCIRINSDIEKYCVRVVFANNCVAENCLEIHPEDCFVKINRQVNDAGQVSLCADTGPTDDLKKYYWSTGDSTGCISLPVGFKGEICVKVLDSRGCWSRDCISIAGPECKVVITHKKDGDSSYLCAEISSNLRAKFVWNDGRETECIKIEKDGYYCVKAYFGNGCEASACYTISDDHCRIGIRKVAVEDGFLLSASIKSGLEFKEILWSTEETSQTIFVDQSGEYCVKVLLSNGCEATACIKVEMPDCGLTIAREGNVLIARTKGKEPLYVEWSTGETTQKIVIADLGLYCVKLVDAAGCTADACIDLRPRGLTKDGAGQNGQESGGGKWLAYQNAALDVFPNPSQDKLYFNTNGLTDGNYQYTIYDLSGQVVSKGIQTINQQYNNRNELITEDLQTGMYFVRLWSDNQNYQAKFFKQ